MLAYLPLMLLPLIAYNIVAFATAEPLDAEIGRISMVSGAEWIITLSDVLILFALAILFFEILKSTRTSAISVVDHILSTTVFIIALVEFLLVGPAGTSTFFIIVMIALIDVMAGFSVTIRSARRDFAIGPYDAQP